MRDASERISAAQRSSGAARGQRPAASCGSTKSGLNDQAVEWRDDKNIETTQSIVAMDDRGQRQLTFAFLRRLIGTVDGKPEVQVLVVFAEDDFVRTCGVDLEDA